MANIIPLFTTNRHKVIFTAVRPVDSCLFSQLQKDLGSFFFSFCLSRVQLMTHCMDIYFKIFHFHFCLCLFYTFCRGAPLSRNIQENLYRPEHVTSELTSDRLGREKNYNKKKGKVDMCSCCVDVFLQYCGKKDTKNSVEF